MKKPFAELWPVLAEAFAWDGSWRDIYIIGAGNDAWNAVLQWICSGERPFRLTTGGNVLEDYPRDIGMLVAAENRELSNLIFEISGIAVNCHFFEIETVEFDIDPRQVNSDNWPDLAEFLLGLSRVAERPCLLTEENAQEQVIAVADFAKGSVTADRSYPGAFELPRISI